MPSADDLRAQINKAFGAEVVVRGSDEGLKVTYLPTGLLPIDILLQGGLPRGRMVEVTGNYSTLKSYIGLNAIKTTQQAGGVCALIDTEHAYDPAWAEAIGVNTKNLILWPNPDTEGSKSGEEALSTAEILILNRADLIVIDSIAALLPEQEREKSLHGNKVQPGRVAQLMSLALRKLTAANSKTAVMWVNQLREQIGVTFGNPERATGGRAMGYYASIRMNIRRAGKTTRTEKMFDGSEFKSTNLEIAQSFVATTEKNKLNKPHRSMYFDFRLENPVGIDNVKFLFSQAVQLGLVQKTGGSSWEYKALGLKTRGKDAFLARHEEWAESVEEAVREAHGMSPLPGSPKRARNAAGRSKSASSKSVGTGNTRARVRGASSSTDRTGKKSLR